MDASDLTGLLLKGERLVWSGQPAQGLLLTSRDWLLIPCSLVAGGFAIFVVGSAFLFEPGVPIFAKLMSVPVVFFGLYIVAGRFPLDAWIRRGVYYAVTDKRILILR